MTRTVDNRESQDGPVLSPQGVCNQSAEDRGEVDRRGEHVVVALGLFLAHKVLVARRIEHVLGHEDYQNRLHAVDVGDSLRELVGGRRRREVGLAHRELWWAAKEGPVSIKGRPSL